jgi:hypothetical protein
MPADIVMTGHGLTALKLRQYYRHDLQIATNTDRLTYFEKSRCEKCFTVEWPFQLIAAAIAIQQSNPRQTGRCINIIFLQSSA